MKHLINSIIIVMTAVIKIGKSSTL